MDTNLAIIEETKAALVRNKMLQPEEATVLIAVAEELYGRLYEVEQILDEYSRAFQTSRDGNHSHRGK